MEDNTFDDVQASYPAPAPPPESAPGPRLPADGELAILSSELRADLRRRGILEDSIDDVVQETWLRTLGRPPLGQEHLRGWLRVVARRLVWEWLRTNRHRRDRERANARPGTYCEEWSTGEESALVKQVRALPPSLARVVELRYLEGRGPKEIAQILGCPPATVRSQLKRGLDALRTRMPAAPERRSRFQGLAGLLAFLPFLDGRVGRTARSKWGLCVVAGMGLGLVVFLGAGLREHSGTSGVESTAGGPSDSGLRNLLVPATASAERRVGPSHAEEPSSTASPRLVGVVLDPEGRPVPGAALYAGQTLELSEDPPFAYSDEEGRFALPDRRPETLVWAGHREWCESDRCYVDTLAAADRLQLQLKRGTLRRFRIESERGEPVADSPVLFGPLVRRSPTLSTRGGYEFPPGPIAGRTDASGEVELRLPELPLSLAVTLADGRVAREALLSEEERFGGTWVVSLSGWCVLEGQVLQDGVPVAAARIQVLQRGTLAGETSSAADGSFRLPDLAPEAYELRAFSEDPSQAGESFAEAGTLEAGETRQRELVLSRQHTIFGRVLSDVSLLGAAVEVSALVNERRERPPRTLPLASDGSFRVPGCLSIDHRVNVHFAEGGIAGTTTRLRPGLELQDLEVPAPPQGRGDVRVRFEASPARMPSLVELRDLRRGPFFLLPVESPTHEASFQDLPAGDYQVVAWIPGFGTWCTEAAFPVPGTPRLDLRIPEPTHVAVQVSIPRGIDPDRMRASVAIPGFHVSGFEGASGTRAWKDLSCAGPGIFEGELLPGAYRLLVQCTESFQSLQEIEVSETREVLFRVAAQFSVQIFVRTVTERPLLRGEALRLEVVDETGARLAESLQVSSPGAHMVPLGARRIRFTSEQGLEGSLELGPEDLLPGAPRCFTVLLAQKSTNLAALPGGQASALPGD